MIYYVPNLTAESVLKMDKELNDIIPSEDGMTLNFSQMTNFDPFPMLLAGAIIRCYRNKYPDIDFHLSGLEEKGYAGTMGFFKYIDPRISYGKMPGEAPGSHKYIPITPIFIDKLQQAEKSQGNNLSINEVVENEAEKLSYIIDRNENEELHHVLTYLFREIIRNAPEHAKCHLIWVCGQFWPSFNLAEIAILDEGIGIFNSITQNPIHEKYIKDNQTALKYAVKAGISQTFSPSQKQKNNDVWSNSGFGLYMVSNICKHLKGSFYLASGSNFIKITSEDREPCVGETSFNGTAIQIRIKTNKITNAQQIISTILKDGLEEARKLRNAFKKASKPSKELRITFDI